IRANWIMHPCPTRRSSDLSSEITGENAAADPLIKERVWEALRGHFRPEFLNRVDEVIIFNALGREQIKHIVDIQMQGLEKRLARSEEHTSELQSRENLVCR